MTTVKDYTVKWNRYAYAGFILLSCYFLFISQDLEAATANLGIALIFDPFDQQQSWPQRPRWQRAWLLVHLSLVLVGFGFLVLGR